MSILDRYGRATYTPTQLDAYYERIGLPSQYRVYSASSTSSFTPLELLSELQKYTVAAIPFESLALHYSSHHTISIDPAALFHKIVESANGRGGYCMENSCLFGTVLRSLGFDVYPTGARVNEAVQPISAADGWQGPKFDGWNHMVNIVTIEGNQFLVDVGHGSAGPHHPVPLKPGYSAINIGEQTIRLTQENIPDLLTSKSASSSAPQQLWLYSYRHQDDGPWIPAYCFSETEFTPSDFTMMSSFMSTSRTSMFVTSVLCVKLIMENGELVGDLTLFGGELKKRIQGKSELLAECTTEQQRIDALDKWMGIQLTEEERNGIRGMLSELI